MVTLHLTIVIITLLFVAYSDEQALLWLLGKKQTLRGRTISILHNAVSIGLALIIVTGGFLYAKAPRAYITDATFIVKMIAVATLIVNTYFIERLSTVAATQAYGRVPKNIRRQIAASGAVSVLGWGTALLCGYLLS